MAIFEIYASNDPEQTRFVKDKGALLALVLPAVWLAWHRLWYALAIYLCLAAFFFVIGSTQWATIVSVFSFIPGVYLFLEGSNLLAAKHGNSGLQLVDVIEADDLESAELKWFSKKPGNRDINIPDASANEGSSLPPNISKPQSDRPEFGLFADG